MAHMNRPASLLWETEPYDPRPDWEADPLPTSVRLRVLEGLFLLAEFDEDTGGPGLDPYYKSRKHEEEDDLGFISIIVA